MSEQTSVVPGEVDWSGENPGMYLRESPEGQLTAMVNFFRVVVSPHGPGHAAFVLLDPNGNGTGALPNACYTDNEPLARYLASNFVAFFSAYKGNPHLETLEYRSADRFSHEGDHTSSWTETVSGPGVNLVMTWADLYDTFQLDVPADRSATHKHRMFSLFVSARQGICTFNGVQAPGIAVARDAHGRPGSSAFLAFSETWMKV